MSLINATYFNGALVLPGVDVTNPDNATLTGYITRLEPEFLTKALGYSMAKTFQADITQAKWINLKVGVEYTVNDIIYKWQGLANAVLASPIANYVYWCFLRDTASHVGNTGVNRSKAENVVNDDPIQKQVTAWNDMVRILREMKHFLDNNRDIYTEWQYHLVDCDLYRKLNIFNL